MSIFGNLLVHVVLPTPLGRTHFLDHKIVYLDAFIWLKMYALFALAIGDCVQRFVLYEKGLRERLFAVRWLLMDPSMHATTFGHSIIFGIPSDNHELCVRLHS